jgi:hypothetical protein
LKLHDVIMGLYDPCSALCRVQHGQGAHPGTEPQTLEYET